MSGGCEGGWKDVASFLCANQEMLLRGGDMLSEE